MVNTTVQRASPNTAHHWTGQVALAAATLVLACTAHAETITFLINPGDQGGTSPAAAIIHWKKTVENAMRKAKLPDAEIKLSTDSSEDLATTRSQIYDVYVAPAHVIGSAVRYGYTPVLGVNQPQRVVLATLKTSPITDLAGAKNSRLGRPMQDSLVTYLLRGELNAANTTARQHFSQQYETRYQDALLVCLKVQRCDVVAVEQSLFDGWQKAGEPVRAVMQSKDAPGLSVALKKKSRVDPRALQAALENAWRAEASQGGALLVALQNKDFAYVSTLGYFTPNQLPGVTLASIADIGKLLAGGAVYVDTRNKAEFESGHVPGAKLVPYQEHSPKEADFDAAQDKFDLAALPADRVTALIFGCNGPECWKSFKASTAARKAGYTKVYWFREGFPGWLNAGNKVATGS